MLAHSLLKVLKNLIGSPKLACVKLFEIIIATIDMKKKIIEIDDLIDLLKFISLHVTYNWSITPITNYHAGPTTVFITF